jgi:hypothetical protein
MPVVAPYIPVKNAAMIAWLANFSGLITASPATYGLAAGDATSIAAINTAMAAAYALITSPSTKTAATVAAFNALKAGDLPPIRQYAQMISLNAGVSSANKIAVGVNPRTSVPTPITAPTTNPVLTVASASTAGLILRYRDSVASPSVKSKPFGVIAVQVYAMASTTVVTDPTTLPFVLSATKSPLTLSLPATAGKVCYIVARYITRKGLVGPWSPIISYVSAQA